MLLFILCVYCFYKPIEIEDIWWHLKTGEWIVQHQAVPWNDIFSFSEENKASGISPEWLGSLGLYAIYKYTGLSGLKLFRTLFFCLVLLLLFSRSKNKIPDEILCLLLIGLLIPLNQRLFLRPFIVNFLFIQFFLISLFDYLKTNKRFYLLILLLLAVFWLNIHLGCFIYGSIILWSFMISRLITAKTCQEKQQTKDLSATIALFYFCFFITPYGLKGFLYPFQTFLFPDFINLDFLRETIMELRPPLYLLTSSIYLMWFLLLSGITIAVFLRKKTNRLLHALLFLGALSLYLTAARAIVFFALVCTYLLIECLQKEEGKRLLPKSKLPFLILTIFLAGSIVYKNNTYCFVDGKTQRYNSFLIEPYAPVKTIRFLKKNNVTGKVFNSDSLGGFLIWTCYPEIKTFTDGRQYNKHQFENYISISRNPSAEWESVEKNAHMEIVILDTNSDTSFKLAEYLNKLTRWKLAHIDGDTVVFLKNSFLKKYPDVPILEKHARTITYNKKGLLMLKKALGQKPPGLFSKNYVYINAAEEGVVLFALGYHGAGVQKVKQAVEAGLGYNVRVRGIIKVIFSVLMNKK